MGELHAKFAWAGYSCCLWILRPGPVIHWHCGQALCLEARPCPPHRSLRHPPHRSLRRPPRRWGLVSCWRATTLPRVRYKILPAQLLGGENGTKLSLHVEKAPNRAISGEQGEFCTAHTVRGGVLGEFCTEAARRGSCWARFVSPWHLPCVQLPGFLHPPAPQPGPRPLQHARHWWRWGFCSIRSWLAACRRRVVPLMTPFPPFGGGPAAPSAASARAPSRWTSPRRARRRSLTTASSRRRRNMSAALDRLKQQNEPE